MDSNYVMGMTPQEMFELENDDVIEWIEKNRENDYYARDLYNWFKKNGDLTEGQIIATRRIIKREEIENAEPIDISGPGYTKLFAGFVRIVLVAAKTPRITIKNIIITLSINDGMLKFIYCGYVIGKSDAHGKLRITEHAKDPQIEIIKRIGQDVLAQAVEHGKRTGVCSCCGRRLTHKQSVELGIGPVCREKWGW